MQDFKKALKKLKKFIKKNKDFIDLIMVSKDFMLKAKQYPELVNIETKYISDKSEEDEDMVEKEVWLLFGVPIVLNNALIEGLIIIDSNQEYLILNNF